MKKMIALFLFLSTYLLSGKILPYSHCLCPSDSLRILSDTYTPNSTSSIGYYPEEYGNSQVFHDPKTPINYVLNEEQLSCTTTYRWFSTVNECHPRC